MLIDVFDSVRFRIDRLRLNGDERKMVYTHLAMLMRNGLSQQEALARLVAVYGREGKRPGAIKAVVCRECLEGLSASDTVADTLSDWVPYDEHSTIAASANADGGFQQGLTRAKELVERKQRMSAVLRKKLSEPLVQALALLGLMFYLAHNALPQILKMTSKDQWGFSAYAMDFIANYVGNYGIVWLCILIALSIFTLWSINNLTGRFRLILESVPPWSIVRRLRGSAFLYNFGMLQSSGVMGMTILKGFLEYSNPYMTERINGAIVGVKNGKSIGEALYQAGYEFPSREGVEFARAIGGLKEGHDALKIFAMEWMDQTVEDVSAIADGIALLVQLANIGTIALVFMGAGSIGSAAFGAF